MKKVNLERWAPVAEAFKRLTDEGATPSEAAERMRGIFSDLADLQITTIIREVSRVFADATKVEIADAAVVDVPPALKEEFPALLTIEDHRPCFFWADLHLPQHNERLLEAGFNLAAKNGVKRLFLPGDTLNLGFMSGFPAMTKHSPTMTDLEMSVCEQVFDLIFGAFDEVIIVGGNHDEGRFSRVTENKIDFKRLLRMVIGDKIDRLTMTSRRYCLLETYLGTWRITHQAGRGRKKQLSSANELSVLEGQNVLMGHEHTLGVVKNNTGKNWACNAGVMGDESVMEYKQSDTLHTRWAPGFVEMNEDAFPIIWPAEVIVPKMFATGGV